LGEISRREALSIALPAAAAMLLRSTRAAAAPVKLSETDPAAVALGYVHDATKVVAAKNPTFKPGQLCSNCLQITGKAGEAWRPCNLFPGKLVAADGWCRVWIKKP